MPFRYADDGSLHHYPFSQAEEMELALELLEIGSDAELDQFLGNLIKKAWKGIKSVGSKVLQPLGGVLKAVAKTALPLVATAAGTFVGGPAGGALAGALGSLVRKALELEPLEVTVEEQDLAKSREFVRLAVQAARAAALAPPGSDPVSVAKAALAKAARQKLTRLSPTTS